MDDTVRDIIAKVRELADVYPNAVYDDHGLSSCAYTKGIVRRGPDTEGCIFGQALRSVLEIDNPALEPVDYEAITDVLDHFHIERDGDQDDWMLLVQEHQDRQESWSEAVAIADAQSPIPA